MKKVFLMTLFAVVVCGVSAFAQSANEKSKKVTKEEVPVAVIQAFEKDYSKLEDKGSWKVYFTETNEDGKTVFTPERYIFTGKDNGEKISLAYSPSGTLESSKGVSDGAKN
jgi:hypothetical protein